MKGHFAKSSSSGIKTLNKKIPLTRPSFGKEELKEVEKVLNSGWVAGQGPESKKFSEMIKNQIGVKHALPLNNCTAALHLALLALGVKEGDEVLVSDYTYPASAHAILYCGAKPVFVDVKLDTYNMDPDDLKRKITDKSKAIIVVHLFGLMAEMDKIMEIAKEHSLKVVEDAACAYGAKYKGKFAGTIGDISCFSFHARKNATSGEGGAAVTNNDGYAEVMGSLSCFGIESAHARSKSDEIVLPEFNILGYNYKMSDINAAVGFVQLQKYREMLKKKRSLAEYYIKKLGKIRHITPPASAKDCFHVYQTFNCVLDGTIDRNKLISRLRSEGIEANIGTYSCHMQKVYNTAQKCPTSRYLYEHSMALPFYADMAKEDVDHVIKGVTGALNNENVKKAGDTKFAAKIR